jgi:Pyruvate/2-oxoacid:ferredoxin oxidoreductase gamma subunit
MVQKYANPETVCISNVYPVIPAGVSASRETYPDMAELRSAVSKLCKRAWFLDATSIALELNSPIAMNIVMVGALLGSGQLPLTEEDIKAELRENLPPDRLELNYQAMARRLTALQANCGEKREHSRVQGAARDCRHTAGGAGVLGSRAAARRRGVPPLWL